MAIKYALYDNQMTSDPNDHMAQVQHDQTLSLDNIIETMIGRGSTITKAEALSVLEEFFDAITEAIKNGNAVNTELINISVSLKGVFTDSNDRYDNNRHHAKINIQAGTRLKKVLGELSFTKTEASKPVPTLLNFKDVASDSSNDTLTAGGVGQVNGSRLKIAIDDNDQGVFFIASNGTETKAPTIIRNKPSELIFMVPAGLASGSYKLEVRAKLGGKGIRKGQLLDELVVN
ncbi:DNA-binding domain-containing protein [uncultured Microscilla sp.]|uniref:HU family DNA-binding protein n=1 Tax=uncultured Microscilla sp. TaxID=432653 RepID=UPI002628C501|nr:DNA-binding domain-containing protein [uncultured Microscilla sp.]